MHRGCPPARARHGSPEGDRMRGCRHRAVATLEIAKRSASPETHGIRQVLQIGGTSPMANIKSQKKRIITNEKSRMRNRAVKSELKTATRRVKDAVAAGNGAEAYAAALRRVPPDGQGRQRRASSTRTRPRTARAASWPWSSTTVATDADRAAYVKPAKKEQQKTGSKKAAAQGRPSRRDEGRFRREGQAPREDSSRKRPPLRSARPRKPKRPPRPRLPKAAAAEAAAE